MEEKDFTIWHPYVSDDGTYEPKAYSFRERVATLSDPCDLMEFLKASYLTEGFCLKKCEKWNGDFVKNDLEMIEEDYVSFETAKLLKEKGFKETSNTIGTYNSDGVFYLYKHEKGYNHNHLSSWYSAPTLQMAMKWIQETFNIVIIPNYEYECDSTPWCYKIFKLGEHGKPERVVVKGVSYDKDDNPTEHIVAYRDYERSYKDYATKEEACEAGIRYVLENLI